MDLEDNMRNGMQHYEIITPGYHGKGMNPEKLSENWHVIT